MTKTLTSKEELFCLHYASTSDPRASAAGAGWLIAPDKRAEKLLQREDIRERIATLSASRLKPCAADGLSRLAFAPVTDAVKLLLFSEGMTDETIEQLDLFNVAEIKRPKGGGMEIKFFDRLKALEKLSACCAVEESGENALLRAISAGAGSLEDEDRE